MTYINLFIVCAALGLAEAAAIAGLLPVKAAAKDRRGSLPVRGAKKTPKHMLIPPGAPPAPYNLHSAGVSLPTTSQATKSKASPKNTSAALASLSGFVANEDPNTAVPELMQKEEEVVRLASSLLAQFKEISANAEMGEFQRTQAKQTQSKAAAALQKAETAMQTAKQRRVDLVTLDVNVNPLSDSSKTRKQLAAANSAVARAEKLYQTAHEQKTQADSAMKALDMQVNATIAKRLKLKEQMQQTHDEVLAVEKDVVTARNTEEKRVEQLGGAAAQLQMQQESLEMALKMVTEANSTVNEGNQDS